MKTMEEYPTENQEDWNTNQSSDVDESSENVSNLSSHLIRPSKRQRQKHSEYNEPPDSGSVAAVEEPIGWSMSLTFTGLTLQTSTKTISDLHMFVQEVSRQLSRDFGSECLPEDWDLDDIEAYEEELDEELDEDSYLVTTPIFPITALMACTEKNILIKSNSKPKVVKLNAAESLIKANMSEILTSLEILHDNSDFDTIACPQVAILLRQLRKFIKPSSEHTTVIDSIYHNPILYVVICTAYAALCTFGIQKKTPKSVPLLYNSCVIAATDLILTLFLQNWDNNFTYPLLVSATLLAWIETDITGRTTPTKTGGSLIHISLRVLSGCEWDVSSKKWLSLASSLVYLDIYSAIFLQQGPYLGGDASAIILKKLFSTPIHPLSNEHESVLLESQLMSFFCQVISLFYHNDSKDIRVKKLDVDILLTLVQDIERWEHSLPAWAKWTNEVAPALAGFKAHMHMIHNMVKILLFRPFCTEFTSPSLGVLMANEQTHTRTTFLDLSTTAADRLVYCLSKVHISESVPYWVTAAGGLVRDVLERVQMSFDSDEETVEELRRIEERLKTSEAKYQSKIKTKTILN
ncbi:hypothetical protein J3Q64DRAFT_1076808 [Phycomyces blakesleeanus]|uniref:Uncharacterized protein n=1 Tax=Phycomyces blakesleeanus TaxID=4837 RepID=A0ABR3BG67_PHYBL